MCFYRVFNLAHTFQNIQYVECGQYTEEEEEEEEEEDCSPGYVSGLAFYSHVENTGITASCHYEGTLGPVKLA